MDWTLTWLTVQAIASCLLLGGVLFAFFRVRQAQKSTDAQLAIELFHEVRKEEFKETLRYIYNLKPGWHKKIKRYDLYRIKSLLDKLELLGILVKKGIVDKVLAIEGYGGGAVLKCWYQMGEYIIERRKLQGIYCKYVEDFAARTYYYQRRHSSEDGKKDWIKFRRGVRGRWKNLIDYYDKNPQLCPRFQK